MSTTAYVPGLTLEDEDEGSPAEWTTHVVIVSLAFQNGAGQRRVLRRGSGFVIADWPRCVLTARHVVMKPEAAEPARVGVQLSAPRADGTLTVVAATACAYPSDGDADLAVLWLPADCGTPGFGVVDPHPADGAEFDAVISGYPLGLDTLVSQPRRVRRDGTWLQYLDGAALAGVSGGAVLVEDAAVGLQSLDENGTGWASLLTFASVLDDCMHEGWSIQR
jgi:hypothetical protein